MKSSKFIQLLEKNDIRYTTPQAKAQIIEEHFSDKFQTTPEEIEMEDPKVEDWMEKDCNQISNEDSCYLENDMTKDELQKVIHELDETKACGLDSVTPEMLKNIGDDMINYLLNICSR